MYSGIDIYEPIYVQWYINALPWWRSALAMLPVRRFKISREEYKNTFFKYITYFKEKPKVENKQLKLI